MTTLELVDKLRERADVTYDEAKAALDECGDDLLEAMILLEKQGKVRAPQNGGYYTSKQKKKHGGEYYHENFHQQNDRGGSASETFGRFFRFCGQMIHKANTNQLEVRKNGRYLIALPLSVLIIFLLIAPWAVIPLLIVGLILGCRYKFRGADVENTNINSAMDAVSDAAQSIKDELTSGAPGKRDDE